MYSRRHSRKRTHVDLTLPSAEQLAKRNYVGTMNNDIFYNLYRQ